MHRSHERGFRGHKVVTVGVKNGTEDLKKARFYTDYLINMEDAENEYE